MKNVHYYVLGFIIVLFAIFSALYQPSSSVQLKQPSEINVSKGYQTPFKYTAGNYPSKTVGYMDIYNNLVDSSKIKEYDYRQLHCLALNVYHESAIDIIKGKMGVASVTKTRVKLSSYPDDYCKVISQGVVKNRHDCQFSWRCDGKKDGVYLYSKKGKLIKDNYDTWVDSINIAKMYYYNRADDITNNATHYFNPSICYRWSVRVDKNFHKLVAKNSNDFKYRVKPKTFACMPKWAYKGLRDGTVQFAKSPYTNNTGEIGMHMFVVELRRLPKEKRYAYND